MGKKKSHIMCLCCFDNTYFDNMLFLSYQSREILPTTTKKQLLYRRNPFMGAIKIKYIYLRLQLKPQFVPILCPYIH